MKQGVRREPDWLKKNCVLVGGQWLTPGAARERGIDLNQPHAPISQSTPSRPAGFRLPKSPEEKLNQIETHFLAYLRKKKDHFAQVGIQNVALGLGNHVKYHPDFTAIMLTARGERFSLFEVKGSFARDDAKVKLKVAASAFPQWDFYLVTRLKGEMDFTLTRVHP